MPKVTGLWRHPDFLKLWAGQTLAAFSASVTTLALPLIAALSLHASPFQMGLLGTMATLPDLLVGLFAGVWADRVRRRPIMIVADISRALLLLSIPVAALCNLLTMGQLYAVLFLSGICTTFFFVANVSYLPSLVDRANLVSANSRLVASDSAAAAVGPGLAGGLIQLLTAPLAILVDALALATSAVLVLTIRSPEPAPHSDGRHGRVWGALLAGLRSVWADPIVRSIAVSNMLYLFFSNLMLPVYVLYATRALGVAPATLGLIFGIGGVGSVCGAVVALRTARRWGIGPAMIGADLVGGLFILLVPLASALPAAAVLLLMAAQFGAQSTGTIFYVVQTSVRQARTPDRVAGRMNASYSFLTRSIIPAGALLGGVLGQTIGLQATLAVGALGLLLPVVWLLLSPVRGLRALGTAERR